MTNEDIKDAVVKMVNDIAPHMDGIRNAVADFAGVIDKANRDGYVGDLYRTRYTVTGHAPFPMDMLRYAVSWPNDEQDAHTIENSFHELSIGLPFTVRLCKYHRDATPNLCEERWEAKFRCKILRTNAHEVETTRI